MSPEKYHEQIEAWLSGDLSPEAAQSFETAMQSDASLATAVKEQEIAFEAIDLLVEESLDSKLKALQQERYSKTRSIGIRRMSLAIAASVLVLIAAGLTFWMNQNVNNQQLAVSNFEVWDDGVRGTTVGWDSFEDGDYEKAIRDLSQLTTEDPNYTKAQFYLGQSFFQLKEYANALPFFEQVYQNGDPRFANTARWFTALTHLGLDETEQAKTILEELKNDQNSGFTDEAESILEDLGSFWRLGK